MISKDRIDESSALINPGRALDNGNAHEMSEIIESSLADGYKYIIIDMKDMEFLSSAGVGSILGSIEASREAGGDIVLQNVPQRVLHILEILDLCDYLTIKTGEGADKVCCETEG
jgi:anti-anti-sigma factor